MNQQYDPYEEQHHDIQIDTNKLQRKLYVKRVFGSFARFKSFTQLALWLPFFTLPYLRWNGEQAILFDITHRQFRAFGVTLFPDDIWMLAMVMLLAAMTLFAVSTVVSRAWCGYFCFQTAWTDWFMWLENKIEGSPNQRKKLDAAPWSAQKLMKKTLKHVSWAAISLLTGISFSIWFVDAFAYWDWLFQFELPLVGWIVLLMFLLGTYLLAGFLREKTCISLCPYARIQGVMADSQTLLPSYDFERGEPRGKLNSKQSDKGDCVDCDQCVHVCPTGIDIRDGQQLGCITCGLCIDACNGVMNKLNKPTGLIRYASLDELSGKPTKKPHQHPQVWIYAVIMLISIAGIVYGFSSLSPIKLHVTEERQPLFVKMSDGTIQNRYEFKVLNKTNDPMKIGITASQGVKGQYLAGVNKSIQVDARDTAFFTVFVRVPGKNITQTRTPILFEVSNIDNKQVMGSYNSQFNGPE